MVIKDTVISWFIRNVIMPRSEIIDKPGFIILKISKDMYTTDLREILMPEFIIAEIEKKIVEVYGDKGRQLLYSVGKMFGYRYAIASCYPITKDEKEFSKFSYYLVRYLEAIYADKIKHEIDFKKKKFNFTSSGWIVCSKNGMGYILSDGVGAGMLSYAFQYPSIEGVQTECQGRGDKQCKLLCATEAYFSEKGIDVFTEKNLSGLGLNRKVYNEINAIRPAKYARNSFKTLIDSGAIIHKHGRIEYEGERILLLESSLMYLLERKLKKTKNGLELLWDISFSWGRQLAKKIGKQDPSKIISDILPALGFGDVLVMKKEGKYNIMINYFPWTKWANEIDFTMFRGIVSGMISGFSGREVKLKNIRKYLSKDGFSLTLSESSSSRKTAMKSSKKKPNVS